MPSLDDHVKEPFIKLLFIGNSGAGKTGGLVSLVEAGYELRIIDLDNGLDALIYHIKASCPEKIGTVQFQMFRDKMKMSPSGPTVKGAPKAYADTLNALDSWPDDGTDPAEWGTKKVLVIDSLTNLGRAAFQWAKRANPTSKDPRQWYKTAQDLIEDLLANVTSEEFKTNVIVISHVEIIETTAGMKGFATSIGKALGPRIPRFFNTMILSETKGQGDKLRRTIQTIPTGLIDLKNPAPMKITAEYPLGSGLAEIFAALKED